MYWQKTIVAYARAVTCKYGSMFVSFTDSDNPSRCMNKRKFVKASAPIKVPRNINSDADLLFIICVFGFRGGDFMMPSTGGSNVKKVNGMISP